MYNNLLDIDATGDKWIRNYRTYQGKLHYKLPVKNYSLLQQPVRFAAIFFPTLLYGAENAIRLITKTAGTIIAGVQHTDVGQDFRKVSVPLNAI